MRRRNISRIALLVAVMAVTAQISFPLPLTGVPFSLQVLGVFLAGCLLDPAGAALALAAYLALGVMGLPVFARFGAGPGVLAGATGGYLIGFALAAPVVSWLARGGRQFGRNLLAMVLVLPLIYLPGVWRLAAFLPGGLEAAWAKGVVIFLPLDLIKAVLAAALGARISRALAKSDR
ncbi:MAG: biotin transporter BioY [Bacillota bacterium]